jgi:hypothetical protein
MYIYAFIIGGSFKENQKMHTDAYAFIRIETLPNDPSPPSFLLPKGVTLLENRYVYIYMYM